MVEHAKIEKKYFLLAMLCGAFFINYMSFASQDNGNDRMVSNRMLCLPASNSLNKSFVSGNEPSEFESLYGKEKFKKRHLKKVNKELLDKGALLLNKFIEKIEFVNGKNVILIQTLISSMETCELLENQCREMKEKHDLLFSFIKENKLVLLMEERNFLEQRLAEANIQKDFASRLLEQSEQEKKSLSEKHNNYQNNARIKMFWLGFLALTLFLDSYFDLKKIVVSYVR